MNDIEDMYAKTSIFYVLQTLIENEKGQINNIQAYIDTVMNVEFDLPLTFRKQLIQLFFNLKN